MVTHRHILGLIIKDFSFTKDISQQLLGDYLVMAKVNREVESQGDEAQFYLVVMNMDISIKVHQLAKEYRHKSKVGFQIITPDQLDFTTAYKKLGIPVRDLGGMLVVETKEPLSLKKKETLARIAGRKALKRSLTIKEPKCKEVTERYKMPAGLNWDFYGLVKID